MYKITREEGFRCLYNGISPALLRQATYGTIKIGLYHGIKRLMVKNHADETLYYNMAAGIAAGAISSSLCNPTDVLKVRLQAQTEGTVSHQQKNMLSMFIDIYHQEGFKGLYRVRKIVKIFYIMSIIISSVIQSSQSVLVLWLVTIGEGMKTSLMTDTRDYESIL